MSQYVRKMALLLVLVFGSALMLTACDEGPVEEAGESVDNAVENAADATENAVENVGDAAENAGDAVQDSTQ